MSAPPGAARREAWRRALHVASGLLGPAAVAAGAAVATPVLTALVVVAAAAETARLRSVRARAALERLGGGLFRPEEARRPSGATTLVLGYALAWWLFRPEAAEAAIVVAAVADPAAALVGSRFGRGAAKSAAGTAACAGAAALVLAALGVPAALIAVAAVGAAAAERVPWRGADNVAVPVAVAALLAWLR